MAHYSRVLFVASTLSVVFIASGTLPCLTELTWHERGFYGQVKDVKVFADSYEDVVSFFGHAREVLKNRWRAWRH
jgi:hypothetical protein